jgi:hypothetical protein
MMETDKIMDESIGNSQVMRIFRQNVDGKSGNMLGRFAEPIVCTMISRYWDGKNR